MYCGKLLKQDEPPPIQIAEDNNRKERDLNSLTFFKYLRRKSKIIIILLAINCLAFFVNFFNYKGFKVVWIPKEDCFSKSDSFYSYYMQKGQFFHVLFTRTEDELDYKEGEKNFYPFVIWFGSKDSKSCASSFNGIFNQYDHIEFIVYSLLLLGVLYTRWFTKYSNKT